MDPGFLTALGPGMKEQRPITPVLPRSRYRLAPQLKGTPPRPTTAPPAPNRHARLRAAAPNRLRIR